jgi:stalled ribosome rescue protein Dom34
MRNIGIWIDKSIAKIVTIENGIEGLEMIDSEVEGYHIGGGSGTKFKGGPQDVVQDSKYLQREKHQLISFFKEVASKIKTAHQIVIFGPAETNEKFSKELHVKHRDIASKIKAVKRADNMTNNQLKALVRNFYAI